jgi:TonB family protein
MKRFLLLALLAAAIPLHAASSDDALSADLQWKLSLDADGRIVGLAPTSPDYLPAVRAQIEPVVRRWHFTPGKVDGRPAPTTTTLKVGVAFDTSNPNAVDVRIVSASTGVWLRHVVAPRYPERSLRMNHGGAVVVRVEYDAEGHITSAQNAAEMSTANDGLLVNAALDAVRQWTFATELVANHGIAGKALVPVCFEGGREKCHWNSEPGAKPMHANEPSTLGSVVGLDMGEAKLHAP